MSSSLSFMSSSEIVSTLSGSKQTITGDSSPEISSTSSSYVELAGRGVEDPTYGEDMDDGSALVLAEDAVANELVAATAEPEGVGQEESEDDDDARAARRDWRPRDGSNAWRAPFTVLAGALT